MSNHKYRSQVRLLLDVLPHVAKESCFALHGGTAINLFIRNMPRLSVDIDLTYLPIEDRPTTLDNINNALSRIKDSLEKTLDGITVQHKKENGKIFISQNGVDIKLEVNLVGRGTIHKPVKIQLCDNAQETYDVSTVINVVPLGQLYGGKICAALDRQHPRDIFDIKLLLENEGFSDEIREGFILCLLCSPRPIHEVLFPRLQDQRKAMKNQFVGMSQIPFTYDEYEDIRETLITTVKAGLSAEDKEFLLSVKNCDPRWDIHDFKHFPAVRWKLQNIEKLKETTPDKHKESYNLLLELLNR